MSIAIFIRLPAFLLGLALVTAAGQGAAADRSSTLTLPLSLPGTAAPAEAMLFTIEGLEGPEAVKYDPQQDHYIISNFGPNETEGANDGYLSIASAETGEILNRRFATGSEEMPLMQPLGMALNGDELWVADAKGVHCFNRTTGVQQRFVDLTAMDIGFLNDMAVGADGSVYVTDWGKNRVIRITAAGGEVAIGPDKNLGNPNGITLDPASGEMIVVVWDEEDNQIRHWNPTTGILRLGAQLPGGKYDGVEFIGSQMIVASQIDQALHLVVGEGGGPLQLTAGRPADIAIDTRRHRIAVPFIALNRVDVFELGR